MCCIWEADEIPILKHKVCTSWLVVPIYISLMREPPWTNTDRTEVDSLRQELLTEVDSLRLNSIVFFFTGGLALRGNAGWTEGGMSCWLSVSHMILFSRLWGRLVLVLRGPRDGQVSVGQGEDWTWAGLGGRLHGGWYDGWKVMPWISSNTTPSVLEGLWSFQTYDLLVT